MRVAKLVLAVGISAVVGCGGSGGSDGGTTNPPPATVATVTLNRSSALVKPTESVTLTATAKSSAGATINGRTVSWSNSNSSVTSMTTNGAYSLLIDLAKSLQKDVASGRLKLGAMYEKIQKSLVRKELPKT